MSLTAAPLEPAPTRAGETRDATYTVTHDGPGWVLLTHRPGTEHAWSTPLAPHGASPQAPVRIAQAVAVRVLHELGVEVAGWIPEPARGDDHAPEVRAVTHDAAPAPTRLPRRLRGH